MCVESTALVRAPVMRHVAIADGLRDAAHTQIDNAPAMMREEVPRTRNADVGDLDVAVRERTFYRPTQASQALAETTELLPAHPEKGTTQTAVVDLGGYVNSLDLLPAERDHRR